jgi:serine/threonine protein kinase
MSYHSQDTLQALNFSMQIAHVDCYKAIKNFFNFREIDSFTEMGSALDQVGIEQPEVCQKVFEQFLSARLPHIERATKALKMVEAIWLFQGKKPRSLSIVFKICLAAAGWLKKRKLESDVVLFKKEDSKLPYTLLIDRMRNAVTILYEQTLLLRPENCDSFIHNALELVVHDNGRFVACHTVVQKVHKNARRAITGNEMAFTLRYGKGLSTTTKEDREFVQQCDNGRNISDEAVLGPYENGLSRALPFMMTMEAFDCDLKKLLSRGAALSCEQKIMIVRAICEKLLRLHKEDVVHNDIKLKNILIRYRYGITEISFCDFGHTFSRKTLTEPKGSLPVSYGTSLVGAPELWDCSILKNEPGTIEDYLRERKACDMFSFGLVVYAIIKGKACFPFNEESLTGVYSMHDYIVQQYAKNGRKISDRDRKMLNSFLWLYHTQIDRARKELYDTFIEPTVGVSRFDQVLGYIAYGLLDRNPLERVTVELLWELCFESFWEPFSVDTLCLQFDKLQITNGRAEAHAVDAKSGSPALLHRI